MKVNYKGFEISSKREKCMAGYTLNYYYIMRIEDQWFLEDNFTSGEETCRDMIKYLKEQVDEMLAHPEDYLDEDD